MLHSERFTIESTEGLPIRGVVQAPAAAEQLIVLVHGFKGFMEWGFFPWLAEYLVSRGLAVCRFDFSRNGVGPSLDQFDELHLFRDDTYSRELSDLERVSSHLSSSPATADLRLSLLGHSRGGAVTLLAAATIPTLAAVVTWSAISSLQRWDDATVAAWRARGHMDFPNARTGQNMQLSTAILDDLDQHRDRLDVLAAVSNLTVPLLVVHGESDETIPVDEAHRIADAARDSSMMVLGGASHTLGAIHPLVHVPFDLQLAASVSASFLRAC